MSLLRIHKHDNVAVALCDVKKGEHILLEDISLIARDDIDRGHKIALSDLPQDSDVVKYGFPIGHVIQDVRAGEWLHSHNIKTNLESMPQYSYNPELPARGIIACNQSFQGYRRKNGHVGVRNEIWIIPTVSCANRTAQLLAVRAQNRVREFPNVEGVYEFIHPYGCSQLGEDHQNTQRILADLVNHPNAGGVLVLGLGCENNNIPEFKKVLGSYDTERVKFLNIQEVEDELDTGAQLIDLLLGQATQCCREECPVSELVIGLKCGGSDGLSGITANPLVGAFSDKLIACGGSTVLTEVPEMFGAETILMNRSKDQVVFDKTVKLINGFKDYFRFYNQPIYENPSPGNKKGGISTLEEKSLGCTQKGGHSLVVDVLQYGDTVQCKGLNLLNGPGNDMVAATVLAAAGCHVILFTTGRGTPLGTAVPTVKISTNSELFRRKDHWIDINAGKLLEGQSMQQMTAELFSYALAVASGQPSKSEQMGFREIAIFKNGVTL